jgi:hypothetical protein
MVEALVGYGVGHEEIAGLIINPQTDNPITAKTLRVHSRNS